MGHFSAAGLVVGEIAYKDSDTILSVYTETGLLTVTARGARKQGYKSAAAIQLLCCSKMLLSEYRERLTLKEAEILEPFEALRGDLTAAALACYLAELAQILAPEGDAFRLTLSALTALCKGTRPHALIKAAFELRALCAAGVDPLLDPGLPSLEAGAAQAARFIRSAPGKRVFAFSLEEKPLNDLGALCERAVLEQTGRVPASLDYYRRVR